MATQNKNYSDLLRNPLWQRKRLEILERDDFTCTVCSDKETELQIHHKEYNSGKKPWQYDNALLQTLCKHCHGIVTVFNKDGYAPLVASKIYKTNTDTYIISTIFSDILNFLVLSVDSYDKNGNIVNLATIEDGAVSSVSLLFQDAKKLLK